MLPKFHGSEHEDPKLHLENFESTCLFYTNGHSDDIFKYNFFPLSLCGVADDWYRAAMWSIYFWEELQNGFIATFLPNFQNFTFRCQIRTFCYKKGEVFYKCWERFKNLLETFPNHGLELGYILGIFCNALPCELYREFDKSLGREFLDLTPEEAWSFFEFFYEHTKPRERPEPSFEPHSLEGHTDSFSHAPTSLDLHDPSLESGVGVESNYLDIACPHPTLLTEGQFEEPQDDWPIESNNAQVESLYEQLQHREEISLKINSSAHETSTHIDSTLDDTLFESTECPYVRPLTETEIAESRAFLLLAQEKPNSKTLHFEWSDYSDNGWDSEGNEPIDSIPPNSNMHETSFVESLEDMPTKTTTELETHPTLTTQMTIENPNTHFESFNAISLGEHTVEPVTIVSSCSTTPLTETTSNISISTGASTLDDLPVETPTFEWKYDSNYGWVPTSSPQDSHESEISLSSFESSIDRPESESGAHLFSFALTPTENPAEGTEHVLTKTDHMYREVVETKEIVCIDFLGVEVILENTQPHSMFTYAYYLRPYLRSKDPYKAIHSPMFSTLGAHSFSVPSGPKENILYLMPFGEAWERLGVG